MKRYKLKKQPFIILIFMISILFIFTFNAASSRYLGKLENETQDVVAIPIINLENPTLNFSPEKMLPGSINAFDFYVSNYDEKNKNEVLMKYYLKIELDSKIPLEVTLTSEDGTPIELNENRSMEYVLSYDTLIKTKYNLKIEWPEVYDSYEYAGQDIKITVNLIATQVVEDTL